MITSMSVRERFLMARAQSNVSPTLALRYALGLPQIHRTGRPDNWYNRNRSKS